MAVAGGLARPARARGAARAAHAARHRRALLLLARQHAAGPNRAQLRLRQCGYELE